MEKKKSGGGENRKLFSIWLGRLQNCNWFLYSFYIDIYVKRFHKNRKKIKKRITFSYIDTKKWDRKGKVQSFRRKIFISLAIFSAEHLCRRTLFFSEKTFFEEKKQPRLFFSFSSFLLSLFCTCASAILRIRTAVYFYSTSSGALLHELSQMKESNLERTKEKGREREHERVRVDR